MAKRFPTDWMWAQAFDVIEEAERMHRQFFRLSAPGRGPVTWEPPVDIFEDEEDVLIVVALPGVPEKSVEVSMEDGLLVIRAARDIPFGGSRVAVRRLEIPHGYFERRIQLPEVAVRMRGREMVNGCLVLSLRKSG